MFVLPKNHSKHNAQGLWMKNPGKHHQLYSADGKSNTGAFKLSIHCEQRNRSSGPCSEPPPALPHCHFSCFTVDSWVLWRKSNQQQSRHFAAGAFATLRHASGRYQESSSASISVPRCTAIRSPLDFCRIKRCRSLGDQRLDEELYFPLPLQY